MDIPLSPTVQKLCRGGCLLTAVFGGMTALCLALFLCFSQLPAPASPQAGSPVALTDDASSDDPVALAAIETAAQ